MLQLHNLSIGYGGKVIAHDLTAELPTGTLTALVGSNGCGKSTLLRTLGGLQPPVSGMSTPQADAHSVALVLTDRIDAAGLRVRDVVALGRIPHTGLTGKLAEGDLAAIDRAMTLCNIFHLQDRRMSEISDGERQRTMIARAIAQDTPLILLDEPTAFLDFPSKVDTLRLLKQLCQQGKTILLSTHDLEITFQLADRLWLLADGRLTEGSPSELATHGDIATLFPHLTFDTNTLRFNL